MNVNPKIALSIPNASKPGRYFSLRLKEGIMNEPSEYAFSGKILAVSDIEGNFQAFCKLLTRNRIINKYFEWIFEDGHLVINGDCFDRGDQVTECLWLIYALEERAIKEGGHVHFILGNHEIMNLNGDWRYIHPKYAEQTKSRKPPAAIYDGNGELWRWLCTKNIIEKIGDILFVHGGISKELLKLNLTIKDINFKSRPFYAHANQQFVDPVLNIVFNSDQSPFWYRGYYQDTVTEEQIDDALRYFGVKTIVTGHTTIDRITSFFNGKVINIDTDHAGGNSQALLIKNDRFYRITNDGKRERIK